MNGQQPNHAGMSGYGMTPQQQHAMMQQQHQYSRMLNQQQPPPQAQQQQPLTQQPQQQSQQQPMYNQNFYQQGYIQNIQIQAHGLLSNSHINNQQMMMPQQQQQQQQQQFYAAQQFQQQIPQDPLPQTPHHLQQQQQIQYNPQALYQQQQQQQERLTQQHILPQQQQPQSQRRQQPESMHHLSQNPLQSAFSQPIPQQSQQSHNTAPVSQQQQHTVSQHYYSPQQLSEYSAYELQQQQQTAAAHLHHPYSQHAQQQQQQPHRLSQPPTKASMTSQIIQSPPSQLQQQHVIHHPKPSKPSTAKDAENSALHNEMIRKQRIAEEKQKQHEREKRETQKIQEEIQTRQKQADLYAQDVQERLDQFKNPILFAGCHLTTNLTRILPFPRENVNPEDVPCHNPTSCAEYLRREDPDLVEYMSTLLLNSFDDVKDLNVKHNEIEANIYDGTELPPLMKNVHNINQYSFHIQTEFDDITLDPELAKAVAEVVNSGDLLHFDDNEETNIIPSTSTAPVNLPQQQIAVSESLEGEDMAAKKSPPSKPSSKPVNTTGKEPKGKEKAFGSSRRKKNEVGELVDSLTPYYDVSGDRSRKRKHGSARLDSASDEENQPQPSTSDEPKFFNKTKKIKKVKREEEPERPATPTEVIKQRELEWAEREKNLQDKNRLRQAEGLCVMAESESQRRVELLLEQVFDQFGGFDGFSIDGSSSGFLMDKNVLKELREEAQKLKNWRKLHKIDGDRLAKLVQLLEKNIRDVIDEEGQLICKDLLESDDIANEVPRDLLNERFIRASEAATLALVIMTSHRAPKQAMVEDTMERSAQLCKQLLAHVIFPSNDSIVRNSKGKKSDEKVKKRKGVGSDSWVTAIYHRVVDMIECFSELIRNFSLNEVTVALLSTMGSNPFFVDGIGHIHMASIQLLSVIFRKYENFRHDIIKELLFSLHQLPPAKNLKNCYRLSSNEYIHNFTVLVLQLIQSVVIIPTKKRTDEGEDEKPSEEDDTFIESCFKEAKKWAIFFLKTFLHKCTAKAEEDYRRKFESFLNDLLAALYRPDWPAAELMLTVLGSILVTTFRSKNLDISLRIASMDYLGTITARLRKDRVITGKDNSFDKTRLEMVVKSILFDEANDSTALLDDVDISQLSSTDKMQKLQQALIDFLISSKSDNDVTAEYAIAFYAGEWYKKTIDDLDLLRQQHQALQSQNLSKNDMNKAEKRYQRIVGRSENMKEFLIKLADKKSLKKRGTHIAKSGRIMIDSDASWTVRYLASKKEFSQSFNIYLKHILYEISSESPVTMRTKAIRCLSQIIEADADVLDLPEVHTVVQSRMMDLNVAVREAVIELVGKYLIFRPDLFDNYYSVLCDRIMDTGVAVRKRVIRIFRDYIDKVPESPKVPEILSKIVRRVSDEEGVKKLAIDTLMTYWFTPVSDNKFLLKKVITLIDTVNFSLKDAKGEYIETFFTSILKKDEIDRNTIYAAKQIMDTLVDYVLHLENALAEKDSELSNAERIETQKLHQNRLLSSLTTLSMISKIRPELIVRHTEVFLPHLAKKPETQTELQVLNQVINMLERVIPLMEHPPESFLRQLDDRLCECIKKQGMLLIQSAIACLGAVCKRWSKMKSNISKTFLQYISFLNKIKDNVLQNNIASPIPDNVRGNLMRSIFSVGLLCRFFDFDKMIEDNPTKQEPSSPGMPEDSKRKIGMYADAIYAYLFFFSRSTDHEVSKKALTSLGHICSEYPDFFERMDLRNMYQALLVSTDDKHLHLKVEVLKNLTLFLTVEEERMVKAREEYQRLRNAGELEDDLANSDTRGSINSAVIQVFWKHVLTSYLHKDSEVRIAVSQVVYQTMSQGLVTPGDVLPTMIAMTTDSITFIRNKIEPLLKETDQKYAGMLVTKAITGIRWTFEAHRKLNTNNEKHHVFRGFRASEHCTENVLDENGLPKTSSEAVAVLNALYACLRTNRNHRRSFLKNVIGMFSDDSREKPQLEELLFIADNLATFPYQVSDEPLFIIYTADTIISLTGQNFLTNIKSLLMPKRSGELVDEEDEFTTENIFKRLPDDKTPIFALMKSSQACFLLLHIKTYLIKLYKLTEAKLKDYNPLESAKITDKPITRQQIPIFRPDNALQELRPEVIAQRDTFDGQINLCEQIGFFRNMFYSLDIHADLDEDEKPESSDEVSNEPSAKRRRVVSDEDLSD